MRDRRGHVRRRMVEVPTPEPDLSGARKVVLVEGESDRIAVEVAARRLGHDLAGAGVVVWSAGGVGNIGALAARCHAAGLALAGLCDAAEVDWLCKALRKAGVGIALDRAGLAALGFHVCDRDLEDELIRALGLEAVEALFRAEGDLDAFRTLQRQAVWAGAAPVDQMRRFLGAGAGRKTRYAGLITGALPLALLPAPVMAALAGVAA